MNIGILGAGAFGMALGNILKKNGHNIDYFDPKIAGSTIENVVDNADIILLAVPSSVLPGTIELLPKNKPIIVATKGILNDKIFDGFSDVMVISGPGFAKDIEDQQDTYLTITDDRLSELFKADYLHFDFTKDARGVLMCGALKNVYAILAGFLNLAPGTMEHAEFLEAVATEMKAILSANGADPDTVDLSCGVGDLKITCAYPSRNYEFGQKVRLDPTYKPEKTVEGWTALNKIKNGEIIIPESAKYMRELMSRSDEWD